jgi:hypothetical protein
MAQVASLSREMYDGAVALRAAYVTARAKSDRLTSATDAALKSQIDSIAPPPTRGARPGFGQRQAPSGPPTLESVRAAMMAAAMAMQDADVAPTAREVDAVTKARAQNKEVMARWSTLAAKRAPPTADSVRGGRAGVDLTGTWATGGGDEPAEKRIVLHVECNYTPALWVIQQSGDTVRAWAMPESRAQGVASTQHSTPVAAEGRVSGADLTMGMAGARYVLRYDSTSGHLRGRLNGAPFWAVRQEIVRPGQCIPVP